MQGNSVADVRAKVFGARQRHHLVMFGFKHVLAVRRPKATF